MTLRICISAYACDPTRGSEPGIGWNIVKEVAARHQVWAITRRKNQVSISAALDRTPLPNLRLIYVDLPRPLLFWKRGQVGIESYYRLWQTLARRTIRRLHAEVRFDVTQHATFGRYWTGAALADIAVPFIWGPVGGGETAPRPFLADFDSRGRAYESLRESARRLAERLPAVRRTADQSALALAVTPETQARLLAIGARRVELFSAMGFDRSAYEHLTRLQPPSGDSFRFISMGRLLHWKGFHLGLRAFATAALPRSEYWIVGGGPERSNLARLARALGIEARVRFLDNLPRPDALEALAACHVLVHPSLHDSGGWVCLEAMAAAKPVICLDLGGPAEQVTERTGIKVMAADPRQVVLELAEAMVELVRKAELRRAMGEAGRRRVGDEYLWEKKGERLDELYASVLNGAAIRRAGAGPSRAFSQ